MALQLLKKLFIEIFVKRMLNGLKASYAFWFVWLDQKIMNLTFVIFKISECLSS